MRAFVLAGMSAVLLAGCGFHLKGQGGNSAALQQAANLYWQQTRLVVNLQALQTNPLKSALIKQLQLQNVNFVERDRFSNVPLQTSSTLGESYSQIQLRLAAPKIQARQTAQSALGATSAELLVWQQSYELLAGQGKSLNSGELIARRDRQINANALLASDAERQEMLQAMAQEIAVQIVQRLNRYAVRASQERILGEDGR